MDDTSPESALRLADLRPVQLHRHPVIDTAVPDEMRDALINVYGARSFDLRRNQEPFRGISNRARFRCLDLCYCFYSAAVRVKFPVDNLIKQQFRISGAGQTSFGRSQFPITANETCVIPADAEATVEMGADYSQIVLRIEETALQKKLSAMAGQPLGRAIEFHAPANFGNERLSYLRRAIEFMVSELDRGPQNVPDQAIVEFEQLLMVSFLTANPHNYSHLLQEDPSNAGPWQVRLAKDYVEAHWAQPIYIEEIAAATGASARSIFKAFKESHGCSPMEYVRSVRLKHARRMLETPDDSTSVTAVGFLCGFKSIGHFARGYREAFGELPSVTLAAAHHAKRSR